jgi:chaperonin GroEL
MKIYKTGKELHHSFLEGAKKLEDNVAGTLGPKGNNVILGRLGSSVPVITKDGVTVAKFVELEDHFENLACQILKQASIETVNEAGDGTTTSTVLAYSLFSESMKYVASGHDPNQLKKGIEKTAQYVYDEIKKRSTPIETVEDIKNVASISSNNDEAIGELIAEAIDSIGRDGSILIQDGKGSKTALELVEGVRLGGGYLDDKFCNDTTRNMVSYNNPLFLITDHTIDDLQNQLLPVLEKVAQNNRPLIIMADGYGEEVVAAAIYNAMQSRKKVSSTVKVALINSPFFGEERFKTLEDTAIAVGAKFFSMHNGDNIAEATLVDLGGASKVEANAYFTTIIGGEGDPDAIQERVESIKHQIKDAPVDLGARLQERITRLSSSIAIIKVGGFTDAEMQEKKHRIEDALEAVNSARMEGIIAGGGSTLVYISMVLEKLLTDPNFSEQEKFGTKILLEALKAPFKRIAHNSGYSWEVCIEHLKKEKNEDKGIDFRTGELVKLKEEGIIDPAKVARVAIQNAISASNVLLTTNKAIVEVDY